MCFLPPLFLRLHAPTSSALLARVGYSISIARQNHLYISARVCVHSMKGARPCERAQSLHRDHARAIATVAVQCGIIEITKPGGITLHIRQ